MAAVDVYIISLGSNGSDPGQSYRFSEKQQGTGPEMELETRYNRGLRAHPEDRLPTEKV